MSGTDVVGEPSDTAPTTTNRPIHIRRSRHLTPAQDHRWSSSQPGRTRRNILAPWCDEAPSSSGMLPFHHQVASSRPEELRYAQPSVHPAGHGSCRPRIGTRKIIQYFGRNLTLTRVKQSALQRDLTLGRHIQQSWRLLHLGLPRLPTFTIHSFGQCPNWTRCRRYLALLTALDAAIKKTISRYPSTTSQSIAAPGTLVLRRSQASPSRSARSASRTASRRRSETGIPFADPASEPRTRA